MIENLLFGFPYDRPGGLFLSIIYFVIASGVAITLGFVYCSLCMTFRNFGQYLQITSTLIRGIPLLLLVFLCAHIPHISTAAAGLLALMVYSVTHVGEILRGFMNGYPKHSSEQAKAMGLGFFAEWFSVRLPWVVSRSLPALLTHWVSLLKDSGALIVISIGELTTVAKAMSESSRELSEWISVLLIAGLFYFISTLLMIRAVKYLGDKIIFKGRVSTSSKDVVHI